MLNNKKKAIGFVSILLILFIAFNIIMYPKNDDGIYNMKVFRDQPENSVDVLVIGTSHSFEGINPTIFWDEKGISSYIIGGSMQPMWNTYFHLKEALKYQHPKLLILDVYSASFQENYAKNVVIIKNTFGITSIKSRIEAIKVSAPKENRWDYLLGFPAYHSMYSDISLKDLLPYKGDKEMYSCFKGFGVNYGTKPFKKADISNVTEASGMTEKSCKYLKLTLDLAKSAGIDVLLIKTPYPMNNADSQRCYNQVAQIAKTYGVPFIDYNLSENDIGINYKTDFGDKYHLNFRGSEIFTKALLEYIVANYNLADHRGDNTYASWDAYSEYIKKDMRENLTKVTQ